MKLESWPIVRTVPVRKTYGRAISVFIHNWHCHLTTVDAYEDGSIDAWGFLDRALFRDKLASSWVVAAPKDGQHVAVYNFGGTQVERGEWAQTPESIGREVEATIRALNPDMRDLLDMHGSDIELRGKVRYAKLGMADKKPFRRDEGDVEDILGAPVPVLEVTGDGFDLTRLTVFADSMCRVGADGDLVPIQHLEALFESRRLRTSAPAGSLIRLPGLGHFRATSKFGGVSVRDRVDEIRDKLRQLNGSPSVIATCAAMFEAHQQDPTPESKERLREAYEAVPRHLRCYCGDMDTKDALIRQALYGPEETR